MEWDAETILSTYSTTDNHPSLIRVPRKPKSTSSSAGGNQGPSLVQLDKRTGLPVGITLPGAKPRLAATAEVAEEEGAEEDEDEDEDEDGAANAGAARQRGESAEEKRQRKQQAKEQKQARRHEKKTTKLAFTAEKSKQLETHARTKQLPACPL